MQPRSHAMQRRTVLARPLQAVLLAMLPAAAAQADRGPPADPFLQAVAAFRAGRFPDAYGRFIALADQGDAEAARLALWMYQRGPSLFGRDWDATPDQITAWTALVSARRLPPG